MKKTKITTLTTAALAATILATTNVNNHTVKADSTDDQTATKAQTPKEVAQTDVDNAKKDVENAQASVNQAQNDLNAAQDQATTAENNYNQQSEAVSKAQDDVNTKASTAKEAQSKADSAASLASEAKDPKKVKEANDAVKDAEDKVTQANAKKSEADQAVAKKNEDITTKSEAASNAQKAVASASAAKSDADKAVSEAQKALDGTGINEAKAALDDATKKLDNDTAALNKAKEDQKTQQAAYDKAKKEKDAAEKSLTKAQADQAKAEKDLNDITKQLDAAEKARDAANKNKIIIPDIEKYKKAWSDYEENGELTQEDIDYINSVMNVNQYKSSEEDKKVVVDAEHMTDDQIKELSIFTVNIINNVRKQLGYDETVGVSENSIKFAKEVANNYHEDATNGTWNKKNWHDEEGIKRASNKFHVAASEEMGPGLLPTTMDELKQVTFNNLNAMIFASKGNGLTSEDSEGEYEFGHAEGILGIVSKSSVEESNNDFELAKKSILDDLTPVSEEMQKQNEKRKEKYINSVKQKELTDRKILDQVFLRRINVYINKLKSSNEDNKEFEYEIAKGQYIYGKEIKLLGELYDIFNLMQDNNEDLAEQLKDADNIDDDYNYEHPVIEYNNVTEEYEFNNLDGKKEKIKIKDISSLEKIKEFLQKDLNELNNENSPLVNTYLNRASSSSKEVKTYLKWLDEQTSSHSEDENIEDVFGNKIILTGEVSSNKSGVELSAKLNGKEVPIDTVFTTELLSKEGGKRGVVYAEGLVHILTENGENSEINIINNNEDTLSKLRQGKEDASTSLTLVNRSFDDAKKKVDSINNIINTYDNLLSKSSRLTVDIRKDEIVVTEAQNKYNNLTKSHTQLAQELDDTKKIQMDAQSNLNETNATKQAATDALTTAKNELDTLKQNAETAVDNVQTAQKALEDAKNHVNKLQNADSIKNNAEKNLTSAKQALDKANKKLSEEQAKLPALEQAKQVADGSVVAAQANLDTANAELDGAKTKLKDAQAKLDKLNKTNAVIDSASTNSKNGAKKVTILNPAAVVVDKEGNTVTAPKTLPAGSQTTSVTPETKTINGKDYVQVGNDEFVPANAVSNIDAKNNTVELKEETEVVDKDGKTIKQPVLAKEVLESSDIDFTDDPVVAINGKKYYQVADNQYVPISAIKKATKKEKATKPTKVKLTHNAFVYDKNGKVVKSKTTIKFIRRGKTIKPVNTKTVTIKGKKYYQVGKNQFIKAANAKIKTHPVKLKAVLKTNFKAVDLNGKYNGKTVKSGKKYHFNEKRTINGKTYYKIVWTNNWIPASKLSIRK